jgi:hypothetical protein
LLLLLWLRRPLVLLLVARWLLLRLLILPLPLLLIQLLLLALLLLLLSLSLILARTPFCQGSKKARSLLFLLLLFVA